MTCCRLVSSDDRHLGHFSIFLHVSPKKYGNPTIYIPETGSGMQTCGSADCTGWPPKNWHTLFLYALTSSNICRFSNLFYCQNQENIYNNSVTIDPTTPQMCRSNVWNVSVLYAKFFLFAKHAGKADAVAVYRNRIVSGIVLLIFP